MMFADVGRCQGRPLSRLINSPRDAQLSKRQIVDELINSNDRLE